MTPAILVLGSLMIFWASTSIIVFLPAITMDESPSDAWRAKTPLEMEGHSLYVRNGCSYCHSLFIRTVDWGFGAERLAQKGDYVGQEPAILGTERTGPDLSQEGGQRTDDWQIAHFVNPRYTRPLSLMPSWEFLGMDDIRKLTAYVQSQGDKNADFRMERQRYWGKLALAAWESGPDKNIEWLHAQVPQVWREMPNPYPADNASMARGKRVYQQHCINCHGPMGDGGGSAAKYLRPTPVNFTILRRHLVNDKYIGGLFYYQIMNGITGTSMPFFKKELESEKIWNVSNYIAVNFVGYTDSGIEPRGIQAANELPWKNPFVQPEQQEAPP